MPRVIDIVDGASRPPVSPSVSISYVAQIMKEYDCEVIPVCENGKFHGLISQRDIVTGTVAAAGDLNGAVGTLISNHLPAVSPDDDILSALNLMVSSASRALPVLEGGRFLAVLTLDDLARANPALAALAFYRIAKTQPIRSLAPLSECATIF